MKKDYNKKHNTLRSERRIKKIQELEKYKNVTLHSEIQDIHSPLRIENQMKPVKYKQRRLKDRMKDEIAPYVERKRAKEKLLRGSKDIAESIGDLSKYTTLMMPTGLKLSDVEQLNKQLIF